MLRRDGHEIAHASYTANRFSGLEESAMQLSPEQAERYHEQGFLLLPGLVPEERLRVYEERFLAFATGSVPPTPGMRIMRDVMVIDGTVEPETPLHAVNKLLQFEEDATLYGYVTEPALLAAVRSLIGDDIYAVVTNIFNKPPGVDGRHPLHQDLHYFPMRPPEKIVGTWTAFTATHPDNGCLAVVPGSHRGPLLEHRYPDWEHLNAGFYGVGESVVGEHVHVEMDAGDTLLFHPLLIHGSGHNRTDAFRRAISTHYASDDCEAPDGDWRVSLRARRVPC